MNRIFRNTTAVIVLTLFTGLAVFAAIQLGGRIAGTSDASARTISAQAATSATTDEQQSADAYGYGQNSDAYGYGPELRHRRAELERRDAHLPVHRVYRVQLSRDPVAAPWAPEALRPPAPTGTGRHGPGDGIVMLRLRT